MAKPIEGRVAQILNEQELAINRGSADGVSQGMRFSVLADTTLDIKDPETGQPLGVIDREKIRVEVVEAADRFSICRTYETYSVGGGVLAPFTIQDMFARPRTLKRTLKVKDPNYIPPLPEEESYVKVGDRVRQLARGQAEDSS